MSAEQRLAGTGFDWCADLTVPSQRGVLAGVGVDKACRPWLDALGVSRVIESLALRPTTIVWEVVVARGPEHLPLGRS